jgi:hypothetical protein
LFCRQFKEKKGNLQSINKNEIVEKYGPLGEKAPDANLLLGQSERYVWAGTYGNT